MEKEFIPYEQALALKELGFDEPCIKYYWTDGMFTKTYESPFNHNKRDNLISAPLYQQAFRWFREEYGIFSSVWCFETEQKFFIEFGFGIQKFEVEDKENAELECLKKLIEIVKDKQNGNISK